MKNIGRTFKYVLTSYKSVDYWISLGALALLLVGFTGANPYRETLKEHPLLFLIPIVIAMAGALHRALNERDALQTASLDFGAIESGEWGNHYRIEVQCTSGKSVDDCGVTMVESIPKINHLPLPLHWAHEKRPTSDKILLNPHSVRKVDIIRFAHHPRVEKNLGPNRPIVLRVAGAGIEDQYEIIEIQDYMFRLVLHGRDTQSKTLWVKFATNEKGTFELTGCPDFVPPEKD